MPFPDPDDVDVAFLAFFLGVVLMLVAAIASGGAL